MHVWFAADNLLSVGINNEVFKAITQLFLLYVFMSHQLLYISYNCFSWEKMTNNFEMPVKLYLRGIMEIKSDRLCYGVLHFCYKDYIIFNNNVLQLPVVFFFKFRSSENNTMILSIDFVIKIQNNAKKRETDTGLFPRKDNQYP